MKKHDFALLLVMVLVSGCAERAPQTEGTDAEFTQPTEVRRAANPVLAGDHPDPHVLRVEKAGVVEYLLLHTPAPGEDIPIYRSADLISWELVGGAFGRTSEKGSLNLNDKHFCHIWAPDLVMVREGVYMLSFSAVAFSEEQEVCPAYADNGGVFVASSSSAYGPFAIVETAREHEPFPIATASSCPTETSENLPHSQALAESNCGPGLPCHHRVRLDSFAWRDGPSGPWWMAYSWHTIPQPAGAWETFNYGQHVGVLRLDDDDPFTVACDVDAPQVHIGNPHHAETFLRLANACKECDEKLSFTMNRFNEPFVRDGLLFGINEGAALFRRGDLVYALMSGSTWDSAFYSVFWVAAPTVEELWFENPERLVGRALIPSDGESFGHGTPVLGPDGESWYYVYHGLDNDSCRLRGDCSRDLWVSRLRFDDRGDGLGDVWIRPRLPVERPRVRVRLRGQG